MLGQVSPDAVGGALAVLAVVVVVVIRLVLRLVTDVAKLGERIAWLEAKMNGHGDRDDGPRGSA
jgi:hypothetical protein